MTQLRRGFKADAERLSLETRTDLGIGAFGRLDPLQLAHFLATPVLSLMQLAELRQLPEVSEAVAELHGPAGAEVSAFTVAFGTRRTIVYNDSHDDGRTASSLTHELSHGLLMHPLRPALDERGCRRWDGEIEAEADHQAGALLVPSKLAWAIARRRQPLEDAAIQYGVSIGMMRWRLNVTGALRARTG